MNNKLHTIDDLFRSNSIGSINKALGYALYGINLHWSSSHIPANQYRAGYTLFTRPQLNMTTDNLLADRSMLNLLNKDPASIGRFVRCTLDPRLMNKSKYNPTPYSCPLVNNKQAFIPILSNTITSVSGWPSWTVPLFNEKEGLYGQSYSQVDGRVDIRSPVELTVSTNVNAAGEPLLNIIKTWALYMAHVSEGTVLSPYNDMLIENEIDYQTRCWRLGMDKSGRRVVKMAATGPGIPINVPIGEGFDFNDETIYNQEKLSYRFTFMGVEYDDPILVYDFNKTVVAFNNEMDDNFREARMVLVENIAMPFLSHLAYPRINPDTMILEFWIEKAVAQTILEKYISVTK